MVWSKLFTCCFVSLRNRKLRNIQKDFCHFCCRFISRWSIIRLKSIDRLNNDDESMKIILVSPPDCVSCGWPCSCRSDGRTCFLVSDRDSVFGVFSAEPPPAAALLAPLAPQSGLNRDHLPLRASRPVRTQSQAARSDRNRWDVFHRHKARQSRRQAAAGPRAADRRTDGSVCPLRTHYITQHPPTPPPKKHRSRTEAGWMLSGWKQRAGAADRPPVRLQQRPVSR